MGHCRRLSWSLGPRLSNATAGRLRRLGGLGRGLGLGFAKLLTWIEKDDGLQACELCVVDLHLVQRLHQLVHYPDADLADVQILIAPL